MNKPITNIKFIFRNKIIRFRSLQGHIRIGNKIVIQSTFGKNNQTCFFLTT